MRAERESRSPRGTRPSPAARASDEDLSLLFGTSTALFASMTGPAHVLEAANPAFFTAIGGERRERTGVPLGDLMPELKGQGFLALLDQVYRTGERHVGRDTRVVVGVGRQAREAFFDFTYEARRDSGGNVIGVRMIGVETTQAKHARRLAAEQRALLEQIARQAPLPEVLEGMCRVIEELSPDVIVSVLLADEDGRRLHHGAAPSLPVFYNQAIDGIATGEGAGSCGTAAHRRRKVIVTDIATDPLWDDFRDLAVRAGLAACWSTPILARDGRVLGTFAMYHRTPRAPQDTDLALARLFVDTAGLAIERHHAEQARRTADAREKAARDDLSFLLNVSTALAGPLDEGQTLQRVADLAVPVLAPLAVVDVLDAGRVHRVAAAATTGHARELLASHGALRETGDGAVARVLATGLTEVARRTPVGPGLWRELGVTGYVCVPLMDRERPFGVLSLFATDDASLDGHRIALAEEVARRAASAARNARQYAQRAALARDLQTGLLLPDLPDVPGAQLAALYRPAGQGLDIGGDFYDVFPRGDGSWSFVLGDVCGRGARAATTTALVRHTARAVAPLLDDPVSIVKAVDRALNDRNSQQNNGFVTLVYGHLTQADDGLAVELVRAGHTPPLLLDAGHTVTPVEAPGGLIGIGIPPTLDAVRLTLRPKESLVLYTDGITECRAADTEQYGEARLAGALASAPVRPTATEVVRSLTEDIRAFMGGHTVDDDQAALVVTADGPSPVSR
ncbi:serine phosphatase RsbU (regulator of sigma subunit) [Streptomyces sp. T12]|uniref:SpoIIE family protein phosphatase n=1 Tax=Streptomyces sp. T12 TaxID=477697 RepID=UPI0011AD92F9|nr:SpoIIE family protein phosphatase [Streptomyces sp. T12]TWD18017.1 serine phosphatase RsbU (regulator of sigma subunit) [Streptomyces sp. T12]